MLLMYGLRLSMASMKAQKYAIGDIEPLDLAVVTVLTVRHESVRGPAGSEGDAVRECEPQIEAGQAPPLGEAPERRVVRAADAGVSTRLRRAANGRGHRRVACP